MLKKNKDVIDLLLDLQKEDRNRFIAFIESPFFRFNKKCAALVKLVDKTILHFEQSYNLSFLAKKLKRNEGTILNQLTELKKAYRQFRIHCSVQDDQILNDKLYLDQLDKKNQFVLLKNELIRLQEWYIKNSHTLSYKDQIETHKKILYLVERISKGTNNSGEVDNIARIFNYNIELFLLEYFYLLSELEFRGGDIIDKDLTLSLTKYSEVENIAESFRLSRLYVLAYQLRTKVSVKAYQALKSFFVANFDQINVLDREKVVTGLYNYNLNRINQGHFEEEKELYELFQLVNRNNFLIETMNPSLLKIAVKAGLSQNELKWSENLLNECLETLSFEAYQTSFVYCDAFINFYLERYDNAIRSLNLALKQSLIDKLQFSILRLKCYFHIEDVEALFKEAKSLSNIIKPLKKEKQNDILAFRDMTLSIYENKFNTDQIKMFREALKDRKILERKWLLRIVNSGKTISPK